MKRERMRGRQQSILFEFYFKTATNSTEYLFGIRSSMGNYNDNIATT